MHKICVIGVYFGKFPRYFPLWLDSCRYNSTIDFLIITDEVIMNAPNNVKQINMSFEEFRVIVQSKFEFEISLERPYKICDYKPVFGVICSEYLSNYDFWGHCDFDMIFGNIRKYITKDILDSYDKILSLGHLSLYRNTEECNNRFKLDGSLIGSYKEVYTTDKGFAFDEIKGINQIYKKNNFPVYDDRIFADISSIFRRFKLALNDVNYNYQIFSFNKGKIQREYFIGGNYFNDEFIYLHIKKPKDLKIHGYSNEYDCYFITYSGFYKKNNDASLDEIKKYNDFYGVIYEKYEYIKYKVKGKYNKYLKK